MSQRYVRRPGRYPQRVVTGNDGGLGSIVAFIAVLVAVIYGANMTGIIDLSKLGDGRDYVTNPGSSKEKGGEAASDVSRKILNEAVKYDNKAYIWGGGHPPTERIAKRGVDCSGLVTVAVMNATGIKEDRLAEGFRRSKHWKPVRMKDARPGDIVYRLISTHGGETDHVAFVADNKGSSNLRTFEAYGSRGVPFDEQVGYKNRKYKNFTGALRFVG